MHVCVHTFAKLTYFCMDPITTVTMPTVTVHVCPECVMNRVYNILIINMYRKTYIYVSVYIYICMSIVNSCV